MSPLFARRLGSVIAVTLFAVVATWLLWSERGGLALHPIKDVAIRLGRGVETAYGANIVDRRDIPGSSDEIGHAVLWGTGMVVVGWALRRRVPVLLTAIFLAAISLAFEIGQPLVANRVLETTDAIANLVGIALVAVPLTAFTWVIERLALNDDGYYDQGSHW